MAGDSEHPERERIVPKKKPIIDMRFRLDMLCSDLKFIVFIVSKGEKASNYSLRGAVILHGNAVFVIQ